jgi:hypothetical protein
VSPRGRRGAEIPSRPPDRAAHLRFSFEYYDTGSDRYCLSRFTQEQVRATMGRLNEISGETLPGLYRKGRVLHFHAVRWEQTAEPDGFPPGVPADLDPFQFALLGVNGQRARVFGALSGQTLTFYIVWFDLAHEVWPSKLKHT